MIWYGYLSLNNKIKKISKNKMDKSDSTGNNSHQMESDKKQEQYNKQ